MITIQRSGSYTRPIVLAITNEQGDVEISRPLNEDGAAKTETLEVGRNILIEDGVNQYLVPENMGRAEIGLGNYVFIYQGNQVLISFDFNTGTNIDSKDIADLVRKINLLFEV